MLSESLSKGENIVIKSDALLTNMAASRQHMCGLAFTAICCILFGGAIAACGLLFQYHNDYDEDRTNGMGFNGEYEYYYTQYWLGAPVSF